MAQNTGRVSSEGENILNQFQSRTRIEGVFRKEKDLPKSHSSMDAKTYLKNRKEFGTMYSSKLLKEQNVYEFKRK